jgi:phage baseplate assembly protein W
MTLTRVTASGPPPSTGAQAGLQETPGAELSRRRLPPPSAGDYLGRGLAFPLRAESGRITQVAGYDAVTQAIITILDTDPGERIMRPDFGCGLRRFQMEPNTVSTRARIQTEVAQALALWEPRIVVRAIDVVPGDDPSSVLIGIRYNHVRDQRDGTVVVPFSLR